MAMTPLTFVSGVLLGSAASIFFGLLVVLGLYVALGLDEPRIAAEFPGLWRSALIFLVVTAACAIGFIGQLRQARWRWLGQGLMWASVAATAAWFLR